MCRACDLVKGFAISATGELRADFPYFKYDGTGGKVFCSRATCRSSFSLAHGGQSDMGATDESAGR
jgi:hypothetical protein